jgi:CheY-like chemotaxis protein
MPRILLVDDDPDQLRIRAQLLELDGHSAATARTAAEALAAIPVFRPEVMLMDLHLPALDDGLQLIRAARKHAPGLRIVVLSGWPDELYEHPEALDVSRVLIKPARIPQLLDTLRSVVMLFCCVLTFSCAAAAQSFPFRVAQPAEVVAELDMSSPGSDWSRPGREAALAVVTLDNRATQHVMLYAGETRYTYRAFLGALPAGPHELRIERHSGYSAAGSGLKVWGTRVREVPRTDPEWLVLAHAPILYARADTVGGFTDVPMLAYCERLDEANRQLLQYTVVFSNEDGGTSTRALMARWGRTVDIEYIYRAWLGRDGQVERATIQAKDHKEIEFRGRREGGHPVLIPSTRNNMVAAEGSSPIRYQIPPVLADLRAHSREEVIDARPIAYQVMARELAREDKLRPFGVVQGENISDPRNYIYLELKSRNTKSALAPFVRLRGESFWRGGHLGRADYAISRDGWARTTIELPPGTEPAQIEAFAFECVVPPAKPELLAGTCRLDAVSKVFKLTPVYIPGPSFWKMETPVEMPTGTLRVWPAVGAQR